METNLEISEELDTEEFGEPTNASRAATAFVAMEAFAEESGQRIPEDNREIVSDLICNLGHFCKQNKLDFFDIVRGALCTFAEEHLEEELGLGPLSARFEAEIIVRQIE